MTDQDLSTFLQRLYRLTVWFGVAGFVLYFWLEGGRSAVGFVLGAAGSFGNLWLFQWLSQAISPADAPRKPWHAAAFVVRYVVLFVVGYVIVNALRVNALAVVLGLLASTAAVLTLSVFEIIQGLLGKQSTD